MSAEKLFYKPEIGFTADFIPFYDNGKFHLFYLKDFRDPEHYGEGTPWYQIATKDFINFEDLGEAIPRGTRAEQDLYIFTGSVIKAKGRYHIFYTAHNHHMAEKNMPIEAIAHAVSDDIVHWTKVPEDMFYVDAQNFEANDFRDPFVFYNEQIGRYSMLLVSRKKNCGYTAGFTAHYTSEDLKNWTYSGEFFAPNMYHTHECPDLFKMGDWWYLVFSEYSDRRLTRYVMSKSINGPWLIPSDDVFDSSAYYAAKTASDGDKRYIFGWASTKQDHADCGGWMWGGNLTVHEIVQREDGTLGCKLPESLKNIGELKAEIKEPFSISNISGKAEKLLFTNTADTYRIDAEIKFDGDVKQFGLAFASSFVTKHGYKYEFFPKKNKVEFASITAPVTGRNMERHIILDTNKNVKLTLIVDGSICVLYVNEEIALTSRFYSPAGKDVSLFAVGGSAEIVHASYLEI